MKDKKANSKPASSKKVNPIVRIIRDKRRIKDAIANGIPLSDLKDIEFVHPI
ncbi:hypothetical protein [Chitinophaga tropicalis]|uniref:Uncharacterized protein n=1 Tax=Chitinophaga tropicalis TaxID=2683588 RepID=A0A7K1U8D7_9BACT|nr:hypothetical protein [Chitinophaga tropicalis]MVT10643.1 hypothetical protein [Chitinophaga tropicalis]